MHYAQLLAFALLLGASMSPAYAQQPVSSARDSPSAQDTTETGGSRKDPARAVLRSVGGTVLLTPVFGAGLIVGPSVRGEESNECAT